jgi:hypothetical protein
MLQKKQGTYCETPGAAFGLRFKLKALLNV